MEIELPLLNYPRGGPGPSQRWRAAAAETNSIDVAKALHGPCSGASEQSEPRRWAAGRAWQLALRAAFLGQGAGPQVALLTSPNESLAEALAPARTGLERSQDPLSKLRELWNQSVARLGLEEEVSVSFLGVSPT